MSGGVKSYLALLKAAYKGWKDDWAPSMGGALAFYTLFSLAPLLVLVIAVAGLVIGRDEAQQLLMTQLSGLLGDAGAQGVQTVLDAANKQKEGLIATAVSLATVAVGATTVFAELSNDLDRIWRYKAPETAGIWALLRKRFLSFGLVVAIGFLLLVSLAVSAALSYVGQFLGGSAVAMHALELVVSIAVVTGLFGVMFKVLPSAHVAWRDVWHGAFVTALLFSAGKFLIGLYIGKSSVASSYGAAGTIVVVILWVYYSAQIFFYGAEFTREYAVRRGRRPTMDAANAEFAREDEAMLARAHRIVGGNDPAVARGPSS